jgi:CheY-like chemotaxis protein
MAQRTKLQIVIVEDNPMYQQMIARQVQSIGDDVHFFTKGETCVEQLTGITPDLLVLDYNLEGEMNGLDILKHVRTSHPNTFAVVYSTEEGLNSQENFDRFGHFVYIEKKENSINYLQELFACIKYSFLTPTIA